MIAIVTVAVLLLLLARSMNKHPDREQDDQPTEGEED